MYAHFRALKLKVNKIPIKMVKMKEFTPMGDEESVRSTTENNDEGHELVVIKDVGDGEPVPEEMAKIFEVIDTIDKQLDKAFERMERMMKAHEE